MRIHPACPAKFRQTLGLTAALTLGALTGCAPSAAPAKGQADAPSEIQSSEACPPWLRDVKSPALSYARGRYTFTSLCELAYHYRAQADRVNRYYARARPDLLTPGIEPAARLRAIYGPRLVEFGGEFTGAAGRRASYDPWWIYPRKNGQDPSPEVFGMWKDAADYVDSLSAQNLSLARQGRIQGLAPMTEALVIEAHRRAFVGLNVFGTDEILTSASYRTNNEVYWTPDRFHAPLHGAYDHLRYPVDDYGRPTASSEVTGSWTPAPCQNETSIGFTAVENGVGVVRECGRFEFVKPDRIRPLMAAAVAHINALTSSWYVSGEDSSLRRLDPLLVASRAQQWLIGVHPFKDGNGRTIRLMVDYLLNSLGLPAPLYYKTWRDMEYSEPSWAVQIAEGLIRAYEIMLGCADYLEGNEKGESVANRLYPWEEFCKVVPETASPRPW